MTTSSSSSAFPALKLAHFRSRLLRAAEVSASSGTSTVTQSAKSHMQSFLVTASTGSSKLICFRSITIRATESIFKISESNGELLGLWSKAVLELELSRGSFLSLCAAISIEGWSISFLRLQWSWGRTSLPIALLNISRLFPERSRGWPGCTLLERMALEPPRLEKFWKSRKFAQ